MGRLSDKRWVVAAAGQRHASFRKASAPVSPAAISPGGCRHIGESAAHRIEPQSHTACIAPMRPSSKGEYLIHGPTLSAPQLKSRELGNSDTDTTIQRACLHSTIRSCMNCSRIIRGPWLGLSASGADSVFCFYPSLGWPRARRSCRRRLPVVRAKLAGNRRDQRNVDRIWRGQHAVPGPPEEDWRVPRRQGCWHW